MSAEHGQSHAHESHGPPDPPEPKTPMWLPALGAVLFLVAGLWLAVSPGDKPASPGGDLAAAVTDAGATAAGGEAGLSPDQNAQLQKVLQQFNPH